MLFEINVRQIPGERPRRWFTDPFFQLIVWYEKETTTIFGFQLCYDIDDFARALTWKQSSGYSHNIIDDGGEVAMYHSQSAVLTEDDGFDRDEIACMFKAASEDIDEIIAEFVYRKICDYH